jgi:hypothetical protein
MPNDLPYIQLRVRIQRLDPRYGPAAANASWQWNQGAVQLGVFFLGGDLGISLGYPRNLWVSDSDLRISGVLQASKLLKLSCCRRWGWRRHNAAPLILSTFEVYQSWRLAFLHLSDVSVQICETWSNIAFNQFGSRHNHTVICTGPCWQLDRQGRRSHQVVCMYPVGTLWFSMFAAISSALKCSLLMMLWVRKAFDFPTDISFSEEIQGYGFGRIKSLQFLVELWLDPAENKWLVSGWWLPKLGVRFKSPWPQNQLDSARLGTGVY